MRSACWEKASRRSRRTRHLERGFDCQIGALDVDGRPRKTGVLAREQAHGVGTC